MPDQIDELHAEFRQISDRARTLDGRLGTRIVQRPLSGGWSVAECLEHLNLTTRAFLPLWSSACAQAPEGDGPYALDFWGKVLVWLMEPPSRFRLPTTQSFQPATAPADVVLPAFLDYQEQLAAMLEAVRGRRIDHVKVASPFNQYMKYSVYSGFRICAAHQRRHMLQAERAADSLQVAG